MELNDVMRTTFSARDYTGDDLPDQVLYDILDIARFAPSGGNRQGSYQVTLNGTGSDPALTFAFNEGSNATTLSIGGQSLPMAAGSARAFDASLKPLWYSEPGEIDGVGEPYHDALEAPLHWQGSVAPVPVRSSMPGGGHAVAPPLNSLWL